MIKLDELLLDKEMSGDSYYCYHPIVPLQIFGCLIDVDTVKECEINVACDCDLYKILPLLNSYLNWFKNCDKELTSYFQNKLGEHIPENWFEEIEVFHFSITFNSIDDFGATITCGEQLFPDHSIAFDFEKFQILDDRLNG